MADITDQSEEIFSIEKFLNFRMDAKSGKIKLQVVSNGEIRNVEIVFAEAFALEEMFVKIRNQLAPMVRKKIRNQSTQQCRTVTRSERLNYEDADDYC